METDCHDGVKQQHSDLRLCYPDDFPVIPPIPSAVHFRSTKATGGLFPFHEGMVKRPLRFLCLEEI
jgi:hypothetical protein